MKLGDLEVNRLGFGAMCVCGPQVWGPPKDRAHALEVLRRAYALGHNFFDAGEGNRIEMRLRLDREVILRPEEALGFIFGGNEEGGPSGGIQKVRVQFKESESCPAKS